MNWQETALVFPGQGSQVVGMGKAIADEYPIAAETFAEANEILGTDFSKLVWDGPEEDLNDTYNTQPALFITGVATLHALNEALGEPATPAYVAGHSLGELTALVAAGAMDFKNGLNLVRERGRLMKAADENSPGSMAAILGLDIDQLEEIVNMAAATTGEIVVVANDNCPGQTVISGADVAIEKAIELATEGGAKRAVKLAISIAAHSPLMQISAKEFAKAVEATPISAPEVPIIGNALLQKLTTEDEIREELTKQLTSPVYWRESVEMMVEDGISTFIELGPKEVLCGLIKRIERSTTRIAIETPEQLQAVISSA
jgi:[acyl-carrier-protein] S-malonyltransferase